MGKTFFLADGYITEATSGTGTAVATCTLTNSDGSWLWLEKNTSYTFGVTVDASVRASSVAISSNTNISPFIIVNGEKRYLSHSGTTYFQASDIGTPFSFTYGVEYSYFVGYKPTGSLGYDHFYISAYIGSMELYIVKEADASSGTVGEKQIDSSIKEQTNVIREQTNIIKEQTNAVKEQAETTKGIFAKITEFFGSFFENIMNAFKSLFVPEDGYFGEYFTRLNNFFAQKLGMLYAPIDMFIRVFTGIMNASSTDAGIPFPGLKWEDVYIIEPQTVSLSTIAGDFPELQEKIYFITDIIMVGAVLLLLQNKLKEVLKR